MVTQEHQASITAHDPLLKSEMLFLYRASPAAGLGTGTVKGASGTLIGLGAILYPCCSTEDVAMRPTFDFTPLFRSTVGLDRMLNALETFPGPTLRGRGDLSDRS